MSHQTPSSTSRHIRLIASDQSRNIAREYEIYATKDLFGATIVEYHWGRQGTRGQSRCRSFPDREVAQRFIRGLLLRRSSAKKRIGVAYRAVKGSPDLLAV